MDDILKLPGIARDPGDKQLMAESLRQFLDSRTKRSSSTTAGVGGLQWLADTLRPDSSRWTPVAKMMSRGGPLQWWVAEQLIQDPPEEPNTFRDAAAKAGDKIGGAFGLNPDSRRILRNVFANSSDLTPVYGDFAALEDVFRDVQGGKWLSAGLGGAFLAAGLVPGVDILKRPVKEAAEELLPGIRKAADEPKLKHDPGGSGPPDGPKAGASAGGDPPRRTMDPLKNEPIIFRGLEQKDWTPEMMEEFGLEYGVKGLGIPTESVKYRYADGAGEYAIPGGFDGKWTIADMTEMINNPINPRNMSPEDRIKWQQKWIRTMTPDELTDARVWDTLAFAMLSRNKHMVPNMLELTRFRMREPEALDNLARMITWKPGADIPQKEREKISREIAQAYRIAGKDSLTRGINPAGVDYTHLAELAIMFREDPLFFRRRQGESHVEFRDRLEEKVLGMGNKTSAMATIFMDPASANVAAIDRHIARVLEENGAFFASPSAHRAWRREVLANWNENKPNDVANNWSELILKHGADGFINRKLMNHLRGKKGYENYRLGEEHYENVAAGSELSAAMLQFMDYDTVRQYLELYQSMHPDGIKLPPQDLRQLKRGWDARREGGYTKTVKRLSANGNTMEMHQPTGRVSQPQNIPVWGLAGASAIAPGGWFDSEFGQLPPERDRENRT